MTGLRNADCESRPARIVARTFSPCGSRRLCSLLTILSLCTLIGCGSRDVSTPKDGPATTEREPLPTVPEQSEPELPEANEPAGSVTDIAVPADATPPDEAEADDAPVDPGENDPVESEPGSDAGSSQSSEESESSRYEFRDEHDPNGIGKFYLGREIAHVMGFPAAPWLERPEREKEEATSKLIKALALEEGMVVADIGAGSGVLTLPISGRVGRKGKVFAVDVQQEMLDRLAGKLKLRKIENVVLVLGTDKSPRLETESLDLSLMVDVYHEFAFPYEMLLEISKAMKPGGRVVFVEFRMEDPKVPIKLVHKMTEAQVKKEVDFPELRLKWKETIGTLPWQHVIVFEKQANESKAEVE